MGKRFIMVVKKDYGRYGMIRLFTTCFLKALNYLFIIKIKLYFYSIKLKLLIKFFKLKLFKLTYKL